jgi:exodeoxyribonuclease V
LYNLDLMCDETGNTLVRKENFLTEATELLVDKVDKSKNKNIKKLIKSCYKELKDDGDIIEVNKFFIEGRHLYDAETKIVENVNRLLKGEWNEPNEDDTEKAFKEVEAGLEYQLDPVQKEAVMEAVQSKFFILTGGPGTGKTTVIETILQVVAKLKKINLKNDGTEEERIVLLAPTGRAAQRMKEQTKLPAKTIHSRLKLFETETDSLLDDSENLDPDLLIIDEFSMVSTLLASTLFSKIADKIQVIVVGDSDQLPSIGAGQVLADLLQVKQLPSVQLKKTFRQAEGSSIIELSKEVREGKCTNLLTDNFLDKKYQEAGTEDVPFIIQNVLTKAIQNPEIDIKDVQILTPQKYSAAGYINLNKIAQSIINPPFIGKQEFTYGDTIFREGDRIMNTKNDYQRNVTNGDIGYIENMIPAKASESHEDEIEVAFIGEDGRKKSVTYEKGSWEKLTLAYAISIHKSQGSQFAYVICPVTSSSYKMLKRNLVYTAITRVKKFLYLMGEQKAYKTAIVHNPEARNTNLLNKFNRYR